MPLTIDWPAQQAPRAPRRIFLFLVAAAAVVLLVGRVALSWWVNLLWFGSLGQGAVFVKTWALEWGVFALFAVLSFAILFGAFTALRKSHAASLPESLPFLFGGRTVTLPLGKALRGAAAAISLLLSLLAGGAMAAHWQTLALYWYAPQSAAGPSDPVFGRPLGFYLFTLPAWQALLGWLFAMAVLVTLLSVLFLLATGGAHLLRNEAPSTRQLSWRGFSLSFGFLLLATALRTFVGRFDLLFARHEIFSGASYTEIHVVAGGQALLAALLALGALVCIATAIVQPRGRWLAAAVAPSAVGYVALALVGWYVTTFIVKPNQLDRETPSIAHNIEATRRAWGLDRFALHQFPASTDVASADAANNQPTLQNIRLWDWHALQDTLRQIQEIRTYYDFPDIDIDRYQLGGTTREVMLAARELNVDKLPDNARNWINDKLIYTHGYGVTMNPVNGFTPEGLPTLLLSNMPVQSTTPELNVQRPEIYFGEMTDTDVYVKTHQKEFNYPEGDANNLNSYAGSGGIEMGSFLRRALIAFDRGDLAKVPFSDDIDANSRLLMRRNVRARVTTLAPFLSFEHDPYIVVGNDGRLKWILDGFTSSDSYPYSTHYDLAGQQANYVRNSVKAVIDAYDGSVTFYVFDSEDPILVAWRAIFPTLFQDASTMPAALRSHVRYPELLLELQAEVYGLYHMTNPEVFYNGEDKWTVATEAGMSDSGEQTAQPMHPNFVLMKLPGESEQEFVEILPFTPANRNNMIGWIAGRSDGAHYGTAAVYDFPKTRLVDGPQQIEARIDQNAQLSGQLSLWNQQGSHVRRGGLLVIPCGKALLYAEPIYLQAQRSPMPELRLVVLALQDQLAYAPTFEGALAALFGNASSGLSASEAPQPAAATTATATQPAQSQSQNALIAQAGRAFSDYQRLTAAGKLGEAGQKLDELKRTLDRLGAVAK
jgi:hypothetical protein